METFFFFFLALIAPPQIFGSSCANSLEHTHTHLRLDLGQQSGGLVHLEFPVFPFDNRVQRVDDDGVADFASVVLHFGGYGRTRGAGAVETGTGIRAKMKKRNRKKTRRRRFDCARDAATRLLRRKKKPIKKTINEDA